MSSAIDDILGKKVQEKPGDELKAMQDELAAEAAALDSYRPYVVRSRPQLGFVVIEANGTRHGFQYHTLRHPKHERRNGDEFLSFHADGLAVVMQGTGLTVLHSALVRAALVEVREYDNLPMTAKNPTKITRLEVQDVQQRMAQQPPRLVK
jgi:hypothetical protein